MAKPNYQFEKRKRDMDKKRKKEEKRLRKLEKKAGGAAGAEQPAADATPSTEA